MKISSKSIKKKAQELGFQKVGVAKAEETPQEKVNLELWLNKGQHGTMEWLEKRKEERGNIHTYFPEAKSIISLGMNYYTGNEQTDLKSSFKFSNYAWGDDYHNVLKKKIFNLLNWIKSFNHEIKGLVCVDTAPVMDKVWAKNAGLGWLGKHTNLITTDYGSWVFLGELILDIDLDYDSPFLEDLCGNCTECIDACPTDALDSYKIDAEKCISYSTIEYRGEFKDEKEDLDGWIYGCDICQTVCPWNKKFSVKTSSNEFYPRKEILDFTNDDWNKLEEKTYKKIFKNSAVKRTKYEGLKRNINQNKEV